MIFATINNYGNTYTITGRLDSGADVQLDEMTEELLTAAQTIASAIDAHKDPALQAAEQRAQDAEQAAAAANSKLQQVFGFVIQWAPGLQLNAGQLIWYESALYSVKEAHQSTVWAPELYTPVAKPDIGGSGDENVLEWVQPSGPIDAYNTGDRVKHQGAIYVCLHNNVMSEPSLTSEDWEVYSHVRQS